MSRSAVARALELGPRRTIVHLTHQASRVAAEPVRRARAARGGYDVSPSEALAALGGRTPAQALDRVLTALPWVADAARAPLDDDAITRAARTRDCQFDLLGSGPVDMSSGIDWHVDPESGARWPLVHYTRVPLQPEASAEVKWPWELSRCQHLPLLALAYRQTRDPTYRSAVESQCASWQCANPVEIGVNWRCTMDVAIRAANWAVALALLTDGGERSAWVDNALARVLEHVRFVSRTLEFGAVRGNHYVADLAGLVVAAAPFADSPEGRHYLHRAASLLSREMGEQTLDDGCIHEASTSYHRLSCELFLVAGQVAGALAPDAFDQDAYAAGVGRMLAFVTDISRDDGSCPMIGDADDGRFLPVAGYGEDPRSFAHLFAQADCLRASAPTHSAYPSGGFFVLAQRDAHVVIRCGPVGMEGLGSHAHNDQLSFELMGFGHPLVIDPGLYAYTSDVEARNRFRATAAHSTPQIGAREQAPLDRVFGLEDRAQARCLEWRNDAGVQIFRGRHRAYFPLEVERRLALSPMGVTVDIDDRVLGGGAERMSWAFPLAPGCTVESTAEGVRATWGDVQLELSASTVDWSIEQAFYSPRYRVAVPISVARARCSGCAATHFRLAARPT